MMLVDGSGSVNWYGPGFESERAFTKNMFELLNFGDEGAKVQGFEAPCFSRAAPLFPVESS